jgi:hypothetical protein
VVRHRVLRTADWSGIRSEAEAAAGALWAKRPA